MLTEYICDICGAKIMADPETEAKIDVHVRKQTRGRFIQRSIYCNEPCPGVLYRDVEHDGKVKQLIPVLDPTVEIVTDGAGQPKARTPVVEPVE